MRIRTSQIVLERLIGQTVLISGYEFMVYIDLTAAFDKVDRAMWAIYEILLGPLRSDAS